MFLNVNGFYIRVHYLSDTNLCIWINLNKNMFIILLSSQEHVNINIVIIVFYIILFIDLNIFTILLATYFNLNNVILIYE